MKRALETLLYSARLGFFTLFLLAGIPHINAQYITIEDDNFEEFVKTRFPSVYRADTLGGALDTILANSIPNGQVSYMNKGLVNVDEIRYFTRVDTINFSKNQITKVESFQGLRSVDYLNLAENQLTTLSNIDRLVALKQLVAKDNFITELPSSMVLLKDSLEKVNLSNNNISDINFDITQFKNISWFIIDNNFLSYEDLLPITEIDPNLNNLFPQKALPLEFDTLKVNKGMPLSINIPYDQGLTGITYYLIKDNVRIDSTENGMFNYSAQVSQSGNYQVEFTSNQLEGRSLLTDSFTIVVTPCLEGITFSPELIDTSDCIMTYQIVSSIPTSSFLINGSETIAANTEFELSPEETINITPTIEGTCSKLSATLALTTPSCIILESTDSPFSSNNNQDAVLSPNGDGVQDYYDFKEEGNVKIYTNSGSLINEFSTPIEWHATDTNGNRLKPGYYLIVKDGTTKEYITIQY